MTPASQLRLVETIAQQIVSEGPISVGHFMHIALNHPHQGYYTAQPGIGEDGDFITAPEISQLFGEIIGVWVLQTWMEMGSPENWQLVELGPGRGTLLNDVMRVLKIRPQAIENVRVHLVEVSPILRTEQAHIAKRLNIEPQWHNQLCEVPNNLPCVVLANEFFDALPIRQFIRQTSGWCERRIALTKNTPSATPELCFTAVPTAYNVEAENPAAHAAQPGDVIEIGTAAKTISEEIGARIARTPSRALIIDYGYVAGSNGDTFQALKRHQKIDPLTELGSADITAHVDFPALARAAQATGALAFAPMGQGDFLKTMGIDARLSALSKNATPEQALKLTRQVHRLTAEEEMGTLFQVLALSNAALPPPPPFMAEFDL